MNSGKKIRLFLLTMVATFILLTSSAFAANVAVKMTVTEDYKKAFEVLNLVNQQRKAKGKTALKMDKDLLAVAMLRAAELSLKVDHYRPDGTICFSAFPSDLWMYGENVAAGRTTAALTMSDWMNSAGHRENILLDAYDCIGVGVVYNGGVWYWTQIFGSDNSIRPAYASSYTNRSVNRAINVKADPNYLKASFSLAASLKVNQVAAPVVRWNNGFVTPTLKGTNVTLRSSNPDVVRIISGKAVGVGIGTANVSMYYGTYTGVKKTVKVTVTAGTGLAPTKGVKAVLGTYNRVHLTWKPVAGAAGYAVYYGIAGEGYKLYGKTTQTVVNTRALEEGKQYLFLVKAYDAKGKFNNYNTGVAVRTLAAPTNVRAASNAVGKVTAAWDGVAGASGYIVSRTYIAAKGEVTAYAAATARGRVVNAESGKTAYIRLRAYTLVGTKKVWGPWSDPVAVVVK